MRAESSSCTAPRRNHAEDDERHARAALVADPAVVGEPLLGQRSGLVEATGRDRDAGRHDPSVRGPLRGAGEVEERAEPGQPLVVAVPEHPVAMHDQDDRDPALGIVLLEPPQGGADVVALGVQPAHGGLRDAAAQVELGRRDHRRHPPACRSSASALGPVLHRELDGERLDRLEHREPQLVRPRSRRLDQAERDQPVEVVDDGVGAATWAAAATVHPPRNTERHWNVRRSSAVSSA